MSSMVSSMLKTASYSVRAVCLIHMIHVHFYEFTETRGESMIPTIAASNDYVHALKKYRNGKGLRVGDCIVAVKPTDPDQRVCKRISGMPGDYILVDPSMGSKQNYKLDELDAETEKQMDEHFNAYIRVPEGHVWITGDNLSHSLDSRSYNSLPMALIIGKIVAANDFNEPFWGGAKGNFWGFRRITNTYVIEEE
ncbi:FADR269Cp [Eremothecium gossypii FDAG1]|nr:FADR269Cp [Eremothecium gossypii FDAG1]